MKTITQKLTQLIFIGLFLNCLSLIAQTSSDPIKLVQDHLRQLNALGKSQNPDLITQNLAPDFVTIGWDDKIDSLKKFKDDLEDIIENTTLHPEYVAYYRYNKTVKSIIGENLSIIFSNVNVKYPNQSIVNEGTLLLYTFVLKKIDNNWKISCITIGDNYGKACFAKGTEVSLINGKTKNIENLLIGDTVSVYDYTNKKFASSIIQKLEKITHSKLVKYCFENGNTIIATQDHPILLDQKGWASLNPIKSSQYLGFESINKIEIGDNFICKAENNKISKCKLVNIEFLAGDYETYTISKSTFSNNFIANNMIVGVEVFDSITLSAK
jgi:hypothetical protein